MLDFDGVAVVGHQKQKAGSPHSGIVRGPLVQVYEEEPVNQPVTP